MYSITNGIIKHDIESIPEDFIQRKCCYTKEKDFYLNIE